MRERSANYADRLRLGVTGVMHFHAFGQEPLASTLTPPREGGAPAFRAHPSAESVLVFPGALRALECAFHDLKFWRGATLGSPAGLSIAAHDPDPDYDREPRPQKASPKTDDEQGRDREEPGIISALRSVRVYGITSRPP